MAEQVDRNEVVRVFASDNPEWVKQKALLEQLLAEKQVELEKAEKMERIAFVQGEIAMLRWLIDAASPEYRKGVGKARYS